LLTSTVRADRLAVDGKWWAFEVVSELETDDNEAVPLFEALSDAAPDEHALAYLGAGPVENAVISGSSVLIDRIEGAAERNERFRLALRCAWFDDQVPPDVQKRLRRFGPPY